MSDQQDRLQAYDEAKADAEARRQQAIRQAQRVFDRAVSTQQSAHFARYRAASEAWDAVKSDRDAEGYEEARVALEAAKEPASHETAYEDLERAIREADNAYLQRSPDLANYTASRSVRHTDAPMSGVVYAASSLDPPPRF